MWDLPTDLRLAVEQALVAVERSCLKAIRQGEAEGLTWTTLESALKAAMASSLSAFRGPACRAVQHRSLTADAARTAANDFLYAQATRLYGWLRPAIEGRRRSACGMLLRRYDSTDPFKFVRNRVEQLQSSPAWTDFLKDLSAAASASAASTAATGATSATAIETSAPHTVETLARVSRLTPLKTQEQRRAAVDKTLALVAQRKAARETFVVPLLEQVNWTPTRWATESGVDPSVTLDYLDGKSKPRKAQRHRITFALMKALKRLTLKLPD
jgi:hypothetical protein